MRQQLTRFICRFSHKSSLPSVRRDATTAHPPLTTPKVLQQTAELDSRTDWPTHRIRRFWLM